MSDVVIKDFKVVFGTYAQLMANLSNIPENALCYATDKVMPIPTASDNGKVVGVNNGEFAFMTVDGGVVILTDDTETVSGWDVPVLTSAQVTLAYNALVAGKSVTITNEDGDIHYKAEMGDSTPANPYILIQYYWLGWVDYQATAQTNATATAHKIPEAPAHQITSVTVGTDTIDLVVT